MGEPSLKRQCGVAVRAYTLVPTGPESKTQLTCDLARSMDFIESQFPLLKMEVDPQVCCEEET